MQILMTTTDRNMRGIIAEMKQTFPPSGISLHGMKMYSLKAKGGADDNKSV